MSVEDVETRDIASQTRHIGSLLGPLRHRRFALLWSGRSVAGVGESVMMVALAWLVYGMTGSPAAMGSVMMIFRLPWLALLLVGGLLADRVSRRSIMLASDVSRAVILGVIAWLAASGQIQLWHVEVLALLLGAANAFINPAFLPMVPQLVPREELVPANSLAATTRSLAQIVGPLLGAALIAISGMASAFAFDAATLGISALCLLALGRVPAPKRSLPASVSDPAMPSERVSVMAPSPSPTEMDSGLARSPGGISINGTTPSPSWMVSGLADLREGFRVVTSSTWLWLGIAIWSVMDAFSQGATVVVLPDLVRQRLGGDVSGLGALQSAVAIGTVGGTIVLGQVGMPKWRGIWFYVALVTRGLMVVGLGLVLDLPSALALSLVYGAMMGLVIVVWQSSIQELVPLHLQGRVLSIDQLGSFALTPLGFLLAGQVAQAVGPSTWFVVAGLAAALVSASGLLARGIRRFGVEETILSRAH